MRNMRMLYGPAFPRDAERSAKAVKEAFTEDPKTQVAITIASLKDRAEEIKRNLAMVQAWQDELAQIEAMLKAYAAAAKAGAK